MPGHTINNALGSQDTQHCPAPTGNLCPARILNNTRAKAQAHSLRLESQQLILALNLQRNLGLATILPLAQDLAVGRMCEEVFVAGESRMGSLSGDFAWRANDN